MVEVRQRVFVFGSNLVGIHGAGSAKEAALRHGARIGVAEGRTGNSYAIPTKDERLRTLPLHSIGAAISRFKEYAADHPDEAFDVVKVGCGLAGYKEEQIAPFFRNSPNNVNLPEGWRS
jgi:hypothetical protein